MDVPATSIGIDGREVEFRLRVCKSSHRLRIKMGTSGLEVVRPASCTPEEATDFLHTHSSWVSSQLERLEMLRSVRRAEGHLLGRLMLRGHLKEVWHIKVPERRCGNRVEESGDVIKITTGIDHSGAPPATSFERWLRRLARQDVERHALEIARSAGCEPAQIRLVDRGARWADCASHSGSSFSWRVVMAPDSVARYIVAHKAAHIMVPDHSSRFWLTLDGICRDAERSRQWLTANGSELALDISERIKFPAR
jgi:predicted metal-dependent hydrolase